MAEKISKGPLPEKPPGRRAARDPSSGCPTVCSRAWLEWNGQSLLGRGRLALLELIEEHGSISAAARVMGVSYRAAWRWIGEMNEAARQPLVETVTGGKRGGGATITPVGRALLEAARLLVARLAEFNEQMNIELRRFFKPLRAPPAHGRRPGRRGVRSRS